MSGIVMGLRVYHRRADLFGTVQDVCGDLARVKYEWPYDPAAPARHVPIDELVNSFDAPTGDSR